MFGGTSDLPGLALILNAVLATTETPSFLTIVSAGSSILPSSILSLKWIRFGLRSFRVCFYTGS